MATRTALARSSSHAFESKCPLCRRALDRREYEATRKELEKRLAERHSELSKKEKEFENTLRELKASHRSEIKSLKRNLQNEKALLKNSLDQFRKKRDAFEKKTREMKKKHQVALQNTRDIYERQYLMAQKEQDRSVNNQLKEIIQNYNSLASTSQKELEKMRKMHEDQEKVLRKKEAGIGLLELAKSNSDLHIRRPVQHAERNPSVEQPQKRTMELESMVTSFSSQNQTNNTSSEDRNQQTGSPTQRYQKENVGLTEREKHLRDEFIAAIKEITQDRKRAHVNIINSSTKDSISDDAFANTVRPGGGDSSVEEKSGSPSSVNHSKMDKIRNWFT